MKNLFTLILITFIPAFNSYSQVTTNVVTDGGFSSGNLYWTTTSKWITGCSGNCAGSTYASTVVNDGLCSNAYQNLNDDISQYVTIPANAISASLSFSVRGIYQNSTNANNSLRVYLGSTLIYSNTVVNLSSSQCFSVSSSTISLTPSGSSSQAQLRFNAYTGGTNGSGTWSKFYIDNVVLNVTYNNCTTPPSPSPYASNSTICQGSSVDLFVQNTCSGCQYNWSNGTSNNTQTTVYSSGTYYVTTTNSCGLSSSGSVNVSQTNAPAQPSITLQGSTPCPNSQATVNISNYNSNYTYQWSSNANGSGSSATVQIQSSPITVSVTATDNNCSPPLQSTGTYTVSVQSGTSITANIPTVTTKLCPTSNNTVTSNLSVNVTPSCPSCTYQWSTNPPVSGSGSTVSVNQSGTYTVTVSGSCNTSTSASTTIQGMQAPASPQINASPNPLPCANSTSTLTITNSSSYSGNGYTYNWSTGTCSGSTPIPCQVTGSGPHYLTVTNACNQSTVSAPLTIPVNGGALQAPTFSPSSLSVCSGNSAQLSIGNSTSCGGCSYVWSCANCQNTSGSINTINGSGLVTVTVTNSCNQTASASINVNSNPTASISSNDTAMCFGDSIMLTATSGSSYSWSNGKTTQSIFVSSAGTYTVSVTNPSGCNGQAIASKKITVRPQLFANAGADQNVTLGGTINLGGTPTASGGSGNPIYAWSGNVSNSSIANPTAIMAASAIYCVTVTDATQCKAVDCVTVDTLSSGCDTLTLSKTSKNLGVNGGLDTIRVQTKPNCQWSVQNSNPSMVVLLSGQSGVGSSTPSGTAPQIKLFVDVCPNTTNRQATLTVEGKTYSVTQTCSCALSGTLSYTHVGCTLAAQQLQVDTPITYKWYLNDVVISTSSSRFFTVPQSGIYKIEACKDGCCISTGDIAITDCVPNGLDKVSDFNMNLFPNPSTGNVLLNYERRTKSSQITVKVLDAIGQVKYIKTIGVTTQQITEKFDFSFLSNGLYQFVLEEGASAAHKEFIILK